MHGDDSNQAAPRDEEAERAKCRPHLYAGRLEIAREPQTLEAHAYCPYRGSMLKVSECFACNDCEGLALDGCGKYSYVICARAERDGVATEAWYDESDEDVPVLTVRTAFAAEYEEGKR